MRTLETAAQKEARERRRGRAISIFLLVIMVFSTAGYALISFVSTSPPPSTTTNTYGRSPVMVNGQTVYLTYSASDVANISVNSSVHLREYVGNFLYISSENPSILYEISSTLGTVTSKMQEACYGACDKNLPERNCSQPFIVVRESEELKVTQEQSCIFIEGDMRSVDAFLYHIFNS